MVIDRTGEGSCNDLFSGFSYMLGCQLPADSYHTMRLGSKASGCNQCWKSASWGSLQEVPLEALPLHAQHPFCPPPPAFQCPLLLGSEVKASACVCLQCGRDGFDPWVGNIPWRRKWQPTPVFLLGESHGQRSLVGYSPRGRKESDMTKQLHFHFLYHLSHHPSHVHIHNTSKWRTQNGVSAEVVLYFSGHLGVFLLLLTLHRRDLPGSHSGQGQIINLTVISNADELGKLAPRPTRPLVINKATPLTNIFHTLTMDQCHVGA